MKRLDIETESNAEFFSRLKERIVEGENTAKKLLKLKGVVHSADNHFHRLTLAKKRYDRAVSNNKKCSIEEEKETMRCLLIEIADTVYIAIGLFDLEGLNLAISADGQGITGEHALEVTQIVDGLNSVARRFLQTENELGIHIDFRHPVDEREGVTFEKHAHWQDFVLGSADESFAQYFSRAREAVISRMEQRLPSLGNRKIREQLALKRRVALLEVVKRLEDWR